MQVLILTQIWTCSNDVEIKYRNGQCCRNNTIPFRPIYVHAIPSYLGSNCNVTLDKFIKKLELTKETDINFAVDAVSFFFVFIIYLLY